MLRLLLLTVLICMSAGTGARAGPWPQPEGKLHLFFSIEGGITGSSDLYGSLYAEYGIGQDRTLGLDLGSDDSEPDKAVLFLRWPLPAAGDGTLYAYEMGVGMVDGQAALRPAVSIGRGISIADNPGWITLDARAALFENGRDGLLQTDLTLGATMPEGDKWLVQLQISAPSDRRPQVRIAPSYAFRQSEGRHLLVGATAGLVGTDTVKVTFGLWQSF